MSSSLAAGLRLIRTAVTELLEGQIGSVRKVPQGAFKYGELRHFPIEKQQHIAIDRQFGRNWFDLSLTPRSHASSPMAANSNARNVDVQLRIQVYRYVQERATIEPGVPTDEVDAFYADLDDVVQALNCPRNMDATVDGSATAILDGCVNYEPPVLSEVDERWDQHLLLTEINAVVTVQVVQEV